MGSYPGVFTPTEAFAALAAGADALKVFPAGMMGTGGLKAIRAVLPRGDAGLCRRGRRAARTSVLGRGGGGRLRARLVAVPARVAGRAGRRGGAGERGGWDAVRGVVAV